MVIKLRLTANVLLLIFLRIKFNVAAIRVFPVWQDKIKTKIKSGLGLRDFKRLPVISSDYWSNQQLFFFLRFCYEINIVSFNCYWSVYDVYFHLSMYECTYMHLPAYSMRITYLAMCKCIC